MATTDGIRTNSTETYEAETPTNPRMVELPEQIILTEEINPRLRATWIDSSMRMRGILIWNSVDNFLERLARALWRMTLICVVLHVAAHFAPELRTMMPTVYAIMEGGVMVMETIYRCGLRLIAALFQGRILEVTPELNQEFAELFRQFGEWITSL